MTDSLGRIVRPHRSRPRLDCQRRGRANRVWAWQWLHQGVRRCISQYCFADSSSEYYDAFVNIQRGLFNTRDRAEHTRKRKMVSHTFSAKSIGQFEQYIHANLRDLVTQWDSLSDTATKSGQKWAAIDSLPWFNFVAFDIIGDLVRLLIRIQEMAHTSRLLAPPLACSKQVQI